MNARISIAAAYAAVCLIWGTTWLGIKVALLYLPPITGVGIRFLLASLIMAIVAAMSGRLRTSGLPWRLIFVLASCLFGINYMLTYLAETHVASGITAVLFGTQPFFTFGFGYLLAGERTTPLTWAGAVAALSGVAIISLGGGANGSLWYMLAAVGGAAVSAFAVAYAKRHSGADPLVTMPPAMFISGASTFAIGLLFEHPNLSHGLAPGSIAAVLYLAVFGSAIAFFLNLWLLKHIDAWVFGLSSLVTPVIAVIVGAAFAHEQFGARDLAGAALVILGVLIALRSGTRRDEAESPALARAATAASEP